MGRRLSGSGRRTAISPWSSRSPSRTRTTPSGSLIYAETSAKNESFRKIWADMSKFRADENLWFRVAENTYENFVYSQSTGGARKK